MKTFETSEQLTTKLHTDGTLELAGLEETHWMTRQEAIELALQILQNDYENDDYDKCLFCDGWIQEHEEKPKPKRNTIKDYLIQDINKLEHDEINKIYRYVRLHIMSGIKGLKDPLNLM
jgi:hypothetical protein